MIENYKKILFLLNSKDRKYLILLFGLVLIMALIEMIGVASILPFLAVLSNPELIETNMILGKLYNISKTFGVKNNDDFFFFLGCLVLLLLLISLFFKSITIYAQLKFSERCQFNISKHLVETYLNQPYSWFLNQNSADLGKTVLSEVGQVIALGLNPFIEFISKSIVAIILITLLLLVNLKLAIIIGLSIGGSYGLIFYFIKKFVFRIGKINLKNNKLRFLSISEAFNTIKEIKLGGLEANYIKRYHKSALSFADTSALSQVLNQLPRYILEGFAFGGVILLILYLITQTGDLYKALPIIGLYVFAGYRLMPAFQQIYGSLTQSIFVTPALNNLYSTFKNLKNNYYNHNQEEILFNNEIVLKNINYSYQNNLKPTLVDINLKIPIKSKVGIIGPTGSGKTTLIDIILGLLEVQNGSLQVDNQIITKKNLRFWQKLIGYVPQNIHLSDDTIAANIAFGLEPKDINQELVEEVSRIANIHKFVSSELPHKYETNIGENGVRLSGGQRQRIGIARALYHSPKLLILDEASSALDNHTEEQVMAAIKNISKEITIIMIAHRLGTIKDCDIIINIEKGRIINQQDKYFLK